MTKITFLQLAEKVIREENKPLSPNEIWKIAQVKRLPGGTGVTKVIEP